jgi:hypothetical protein
VACAVQLTPSSDVWHSRHPTQILRDGVAIDGVLPSSDELLGPARPAAEVEAETLAYARSMPGATQVRCRKPARIAHCILAWRLAWGLVLICDTCPLAAQLHLNAGDLCVYRNCLWHTGVYTTTAKRCTLHDVPDTPEFQAWRTGRFRTANEALANGGR